MMLDLYYACSQLFLLLTSFYAAIVGCIYNNRFKEMRFLFLYPLASLIETVVSSLTYRKFPHLASQHIPEMLINTFLLVEFTCIYIFYINIFKSTKITRLLRIVLSFYLVIIIILWLSTNAFTSTPHHLFVLQAIFILLPGFYYLFKILTKPSRLEIKQEPVFYIVIGLFIYFGSTLPLFLLNTQIDFSKALDRGVYTINFISYGIMFLLLIKAYLCKKREAQ